MTPPGLQLVLGLYLLVVAAVCLPGLLFVWAGSTSWRRYWGTVKYTLLLATLGYCIPHLICGLAYLLCSVH